MAGAPSSEAAHCKLQGSPNCKWNWKISNYRDEFAKVLHEKSEWIVPTCPEQCGICHICNIFQLFLYFDLLKISTLRQSNDLVRTGELNMLRTNESEWPSVVQFDSFFGLLDWVRRSIRGNQTEQLLVTVLTAEAARTQSGAAKEKGTRQKAKD